ncbi:unnamed protein product, partial [Arabidopsis halleri]
MRKERSPPPMRVVDPWAKSPPPMRVRRMRLQWKMRRKISRKMLWRSTRKQAIPPLGMYFPPSEYVKKIKLSTRCYIHEVLATFDELEPPMS